MKIKVNYKHSYLVSILLSFLVSIYFAYKGIIAYLIHKELYGGGIDVVISLRATVSGILLFAILLQIQFLRIKDLKSHNTILRSLFIVWTTIFVTIVIVSPKEIYFLGIAFLASILILISIFNLKEQINEEKNSLTEKEIYLLQQLAKKKK